MALSDNPLWDSTWDATPGDPDRRAISVDVAEVHVLVERSEIEQARAKWRAIMNSILQQIRSISLFSPDQADRNRKATKKVVLDELRAVARQLYASTNNEPLQMHWRDATNALFSQIE